MVTRNSFSPEEWMVLRDTPHLVGAATMMAGASGLGTLKEPFALAKTVLEGQSSDTPLIRDLSGRPEMEAAQSALRTLMQEKQISSPDQVRVLALERARAAIALLKTRSTPAETEAFRAWIYHVAENVAKAAKDGGFLGFGGTEVSAGELSFLADLKAAMI